MFSMVFETIARDCDCLIFSGKSFHRYGPVILSDFFLLFVRANEILSAEKLDLLFLCCMYGCRTVCKTNP